MRNVGFIKKVGNLVNNYFNLSLLLKQFFELKTGVKVMSLPALFPPN